MRLDEKLDAFDLWAPTALEYVKGWLRDAPEEIIAVARARLITGHYVHGDKLMFDQPQGLLRKEILEEIADAVNYAHLERQREAGWPGSTPSRSSTSES